MLPVLERPARRRNTSRSMVEKLITNVFVLILLFSHLNYETGSAASSVGYGLALKTFFKTDYRGVVQMLVDFAELRDDLGLTKVPDHSTLCKAQQRLLKKGRSFSSSSRPPCAPKTAA